MDRLILCGADNFREIRRLLDGFSRSVREFRDAAEIGTKRARSLARLAERKAQPMLPRPQCTPRARWHRKQPPGRFAFYQGYF